MELTAESIIPSFSTSSSSSIENQTSPKSTFKGKSKLKKKDKSKIAHEAPDLDIVSGFAFLSFSNIAALEYHIEQTEAKSCSLSINVGAKRKIRSEKRENAESSEVVRSSSKRIRVPSQKILESYATKDVPITELVRSCAKQPGKLKQSPQEKELSSHLYYSKDHSPAISNSFLSWNNTNEASSDISLECSETMDVCIFDDECKPNMNSGISTNPEQVRVKKMKKKKRSAEISDTSCQTMFRIKKKKKKQQSMESSNKSTASSTAIELCSNPEESTTSAFEESSLSEFPDSRIIIQNIDSPNVYVIKDESFESAKARYKQMQATKFFDSKHHQPKVSNKVEKIDYCARSGGLELVGKHHERQLRMKELCDLDSLDESPVDSDILDNCDASISSDNSSSSNEFIIDASPTDQEGLLCNRSRIFAGSSSIFLGSEECQDELDVDIDSGIDDPIPACVNIVKALPSNYLFGHFSTYPDKSTEGTIDVGIQIYENDIQLYMNYASDFNGRIIKIITPDNEESKNIPSCLPQLKSPSGVPKFLQPQEYVKAIRSATERNRRHTLGDLFNHLKKEIFGDVTEYYFSKQAILTKALEVISNTDQEYYELSKERAKLSAKNQLLRKSLHGLLFGETTESVKEVDVDKVTNCLKTMGIDIKLPDSSKEKDKAENKESKQSSEIPKSNVSKKGRPPIPGKLFNKIEISEPKRKADKPTNPERQINVKAKEHSLPSAKPLEEITQTSTAKVKPMPNSVLFDANMKTFIAIAPREPQSDIKKEKVIAEETKEQPTELSCVDKIACNISRYRIESTGKKSGMTLITKQAEPFKPMGSKNVVHIKITNDVMKQISNKDNTNIESALAKDSNTAPKEKLVELSQLRSVSLANQSSLSTQTDFDTLSPCTDYKSNSIKPSFPSASMKGNEQSNDENVKQITGSSVAVTTITTTPVSTNKPLVLKGSDSLTKLVSMLKERALTQDVSSSQSSTQCSSLSTITNASSQIDQAPCASPAIISDVLSSDVSKGTVTMPTTAQVLKVNVNSEHIAITSSGLASLTPPVDASIATLKPIVTTSGHINISTPAFVTTAKPVAMPAISSPMNVNTATSKSVTMTTAAQFPITAPIHTSLLPSASPVTIVTPGVKQQQPVVPNVIKQIKQPKQQQKYISVLPQSSVGPASSNGVNIMPNNSIRIVFKPSGKAVSTPTDQVQNALQTQRIVRLPLSTALSSNVIQAPNIRFLLQKNNPDIQQPGNITAQSQNSTSQHARPLAPKPPQVVYPKPLVKIQPLPQPFPSSTNLQHSQTSVVGSCHGNTNVPVQSSIVVTASSTSLNVSPSTSSAMPATTFTNQPVLVNTGTPTGSRIKKAIYSSAASLPQTVSPLLQQQLQQPIIVQNPESTSVNSKTIFTGMEQVVAKIQAVTAMPHQTVPLQRKFRELLPGPMKTTVSLQRLGLDSPVTTSGSSNQPKIIKSSSLQPSTTTFSSNNLGSLNTSEINHPKLGDLICDEVRTSFATSNPRSVASQPTVPCSNTCSSVTFQLTEPQHDKTCSVVETTVDNSNVVTADKLSVWNIDSSIPDIKSELQSDKSLNDGLFNKPKDV